MAMTFNYPTPGARGRTAIAAPTGAAGAGLGARPAHLPPIAAAASLQSQSVLRTYARGLAPGPPALPGAPPGPTLKFQPFGGAAAADFTGQTGVVGDFGIEPAYAYEPKLVFVGMAFQKKRMKKVYDAIQAECSARGFLATRADEGTGAAIVFKRIAELILRSELLIFDLSHQRPNVYYELGLAHGVGNGTTNILLVARKGEKIHFDAEGFQVRPYGSLKKLRKIVGKNLEDMSRKFRARRAAADAKPDPPEAEPDES